MHASTELQAQSWQHPFQWEKDNTKDDIYKDHSANLIPEPNLFCNFQTDVHIGDCVGKMVCKLFANKSIQKLKYYFIKPRPLIIIKH